MNKEVINYIKNGGIVAIPTDTIYGLFGIPNKEVIEKINALKCSPNDKKLSLMSSSFSKFEKYVDINSFQKEFINNKLPGPYTFIVKTKLNSLIEDLPWSDSIGIRIPNDKTRNAKRLLDILANFDFLVSTSVNISGESPLNDYEEIKKQFSNIMTIKNIESLDKNKPTKIFSLLNEEPEIIRE